MPPTFQLPEVVNLHCAGCGRAGRYRRARYVEIAGTENAADALLRFARAAGCEVAQRQTLDQVHDRCGIRYGATEGP